MTRLPPTCLIFAIGALLLTPEHQCWARSNNVRGGGIGVDIDIDIGAGGFASPYGDDVESSDLHDLIGFDDPDDPLPPELFDDPAYDFLNLESDPLDAEGVEGPQVAQQRQRHLADPTMFEPLTCNDVLNSSPCDSTNGTPLSTLVGATTTSDEDVLIPCGTCAYWDSAQDFNLTAGLNIEGRLHVGVGASGTLRTSHVFVQGRLTIDPPPVDHLVAFFLFGNGTKYLVPHGENGAACDAVTGCKVGTKPFVVAGGTLDVNGLQNEDCPSWTKLADLSSDLATITVGSDFAGCVDVGDEILLTSPAWEYAYQRTGVVASIDAGAGTITLSDPIPGYFGDATLASTSSPLHAVEVARLTRRVKFVAEDDDLTSNDGYNGGHMIVLHTPATTAVQKITGVEVVKFGQQGTLGRYPIHFHLCASVAGSVVSKNVIRQSNQRCVVIHGSHDATIYDNVAYDAFGHCYFTEDGIETGNTFQRNLGAWIKSPLDGKVIPGENDHAPSVFWITNPQNHWSVFAGGVDVAPPIAALLETPVLRWNSALRAKIYV